MVKDDFEVREIRRAVDATKDGFDRILSRLPKAVGRPRSERILEGAFNSVAREEGNAVGYDTIIASGAHAPILHWMRNTGVVGEGEMLLIDAGVEVDSLYTADITRTFPVGGHFTALQRSDSTMELTDSSVPGMTRTRTDPASAPTSLPTESASCAMSCVSMPVMAASSLRPARGPTQYSP